MNKTSNRARKNAAAQESEQYRAVFDSASAPMVLVDRSLTVLRANDSAARMLGLPRTEIEGKGLNEFLYVEEPGKLSSFLDEIHTSDYGSFSVEATLQSAREVVKGVRLQVACVPGRDRLIVTIGAAHHGCLPGNETCHRDHVYRSLFDNSPEGTAFVDSKGRVADVNPAFLDMFGYSRHELLGRTLVDLIAPGGLRQQASSILRKTLTEGILVNATTRRRSDGREVVVSMVGTPVFVDGHSEGAFAIYRDVSERYRVQDRLADAFIDLVETTSRLMASNDPYTAGHQRRVARLADMVGRRLGLDDNVLQGMYVGAMLHDIGKLSVPGAILTKPGKLSPQEWNIIRTHPLRGYGILADSNLPWPVADMAAQHHERLDGSGYPNGLQGPELGTEVRILAACDVVEAMSSNRPYRPALPIEEARTVMHGGRGTQFAPDVVDAIVELIDEGQLQPSDAYEGLVDDRL